MKYILIISIFILSCSGGRQNKGKIIGRSWKTVSVLENGVKPAEENMINSTFEFTPDSAIFHFGTYRLPLLYEFLDSDIIELVNPEDTTQKIKLVIDRLTEADFDFTLTNTTNTTITKLRTTRF